MTQLATYDIAPEWVHVQFAETAGFTEVYGFAGSQGMVNLEGVRFVPKGRPSKTLAIYMHPSSTLQLLPMPQAMARHGMHVLCCGSRYAKNDTPLIMEKVVTDLGAYIRHAKEVWGYERIVLCGWSGGGSLALFYQSQAEQPTIIQTPAGDVIDLAAARLIPADAMIFQAAHLARSITLTDWLDPSVLDESDPDKRDPDLDIYDPKNPHCPPYSAAFIERYRAAQRARMRKRTAWVKESLDRLKRRGGAELERGFVTHRTMADLRFVDPAIDPNGRRPGWCFLGNPETANSGPAGLARYSTLRAWLSQWSLDDSNANGPRCATSIRAPLLAIENAADDAVPQPDTGIIFKAAASTDKTMRVIAGATHYYQGQPAQLNEAVTLCLDWMGERGYFA
ncbi:MAG: alpha/beta hydrolase [Betaproteobacteria bacterium]|nr:alpha/beta hydrolase [Betaproteobacteria bacterium]